MAALTEPRQRAAAGLRSELKLSTNGCATAVADQEAAGLRLQRQGSASQDSEPRQGSASNASMAPRQEPRQESSSCTQGSEPRQGS